jgi:hypothetical protein
VHPHQTPDDLIELAAAHLRMAATEAGRRSDGDPFSPWHAYAGQLDLAAASLAARPGLIPQVADHADVLTHLERASRALHHVRPGQGPADVALWCWQLTELARAAREMAAA